MSLERLCYLVDLLETDQPIPAASRAWLRGALESILAGTNPGKALGIEVRDSRQARDSIIKQHAPTLAWSHSGQARILADQARRLHSGRRSDLGWLVRADRLHRLPESPRQFHNILK